MFTQNVYTSYETCAWENANFSPTPLIKIHK